MSERVFWSVMVPTYRPDEGLLRQTLESVLLQDQGPGRMEIVVVDDGSPDVDVAALVDRLGGGRVRCEVQTVNRGLAGNWNRCIELARGEWIHLLHQDDLVRPGFYSKLGELAESVAGLDAMYCRHAVVDVGGAERWVSNRDQETPGVAVNFRERIFLGVCVLCPAVVVKRSTYERVGGYRTDLPFALDWDMWKRIAASGTWGYHPETLAVYRSHQRSETARLMTADGCFDDILRSVDLSRSYLPEPEATRVTRLARRRAYRTELGCAWADWSRGDFGSAELRLRRLLRRGYLRYDMLKLWLCVYRSRWYGWPRAPEA